MINSKSVLAVIPARSGSKRCPGKNFRSFRGKPLYLWSVEAAYESQYVDTVTVSLDKDRPHLCDDNASNEDVLRYHLRQHPHDWVVLLQPTSPLRTATDIDRCIEIAQQGCVCISYRPDGTKNGAVYVAEREWIERHDFSYKEHHHYEMPDERSLDIDYEHQFEA